MKKLMLVMTMTTTMMTSCICCVDDRDENEMMVASMTTEQGEVWGEIEQEEAKCHQGQSDDDGGGDDDDDCGDEKTIKEKDDDVACGEAQEGDGQALMMEWLEKTGAWMELLTMVVALTTAIASFDAIMNMIVIVALGISNFCETMMIVRPVMKLQH